MHLHTIFAIISPAIIAVQAHCYKSGDFWEPNYGQAFAALDRLCADVLSGTLNGGDKRHACINAIDGNRVRKLEFFVENLGFVVQDVSKEACVLHLSYEISGCGRGGETIPYLVRYRSVLSLNCIKTVGVLTDWIRCVGLILILDTVDSDWYHVCSER